jgi:hypothetical protein
VILDNERGRGSAARSGADIDPTRKTAIIKKHIARFMALPFVTKG